MNDCERASRIAVVLVCVCYVSLCDRPHAAEFTFKANENCHVSAIGREREMSGGNGATRGKIKGPEEFVMVKFDLSKIKGMTVTKARLKFFDAGASLHKVGFSSVAADWKAGNHGGFKVPEQGSATWAAKASPKTPWAWRGSNVEHVIQGMSGSRVCHGQVKRGGGAYELEVAPEVIEVVASGHHHGFVIHEHDGWRRMKWAKQVCGKVPGSAHNPRIFMKAQNGKGAVLFVTAEKKDTAAPGKIQVKEVWKDNMLVGEILLEITATGDDGNKGRALYYEVKADGKEVPVWMLSRPLKAGEKQLIRISEQEPGKTISFEICAVDEAGNKGPVAKVTGKAIPRIEIPAVSARYSCGTGKPAGNGTIDVWAYPDLQKANPVTGNLFEEGAYTFKKTGNYRNGNNIWNGKTHTVQLSAWKDEWVAFQVGIENLSGNSLKDIKVEWSGSKDIKADLYREWYVFSKDSFYPDPLVPLKDEGGVVHIPDPKNKVANQKVQSVYVDLLIDKNAAAKVHDGKISVTVPGKAPVVLKVKVNVHDAGMPRKLTTWIEFNHYSGWQGGFKGAQVSGKGANDVFIRCNNAITALAHQNRCSFNGVPYTHTGSQRRPTPVVSGEGAATKVTDWSAFDKTYEGIFSGSIFKNNHRSEQPMTHQTLIIYEQWPANMNKPGMFEHNRRKNPSLDPQFTRKFRDTVLAVGAAYTRHFKEKGWNKVQLQLFLNNKNQYKRPGNGCYWLLDEPRYHNGYMALDYLGTLMRDAFKDKGNIDVVFRADISRPQFQEYMLDDSLDLNVVGGLPGHEMIVRRNSDRYNGKPFRDGDQIIWSYGGVAAIESPSINYPNARVMDYFLGSNGHLPWLITFNPGGWKKSDPKCVMYNGFSDLAPVKGKVVFPSIRLKAYRRGQQDSELLHAALSKNKYTRDQFRKAIRPFAHFTGRTKRTFAEDAGTISVAVAEEELEGTREVLRALMGGPKPFNEKQTRAKIDISVGKVGKLGFAQ